MFRTGWRSVVRRSMQQGRPFSFFLIAAVLATGAQAAMPAVTALAATPNISSVTPGTASPGTTVSINGSGFGATQTRALEPTSRDATGYASLITVRAGRARERLHLRDKELERHANHLHPTRAQRLDQSVAHHAEYHWLGHRRDRGGYRRQWERRWRDCLEHRERAVPNTDNPADYYGNNGSGWGAIGVSPDTNRKSAALAPTSASTATTATTIIPPTPLPPLGFRQALRSPPAASPSPGPTQLPALSTTSSRAARLS